MEEEKDNKLAEEQLDEANGGRPYHTFTDNSFYSVGK